MADYTNEFNEWLKQGDHAENVTLDHTDVPDLDLPLEIGSIVSFTNEYGITFKPRKVVGFTRKPLHGRNVLLNFDCYWFPVRTSSLQILSICNVCKHEYPSCTGNPFFASEFACKNKRFQGLIPDTILTCDDFEEDVTKYV